MTKDDHRVISLDEARRRRRARELRDAAERERQEHAGEDPVRISDAMNHMLEGGDDAGADQVPSVRHLRRIVAREFADGDDGGETSEGEDPPGAPTGPDGAQD